MIKDALAEQSLVILRECYEEMDGASEVEISPAVVAACAYSRMDPEEAAPMLVQYLCVLKLRQLARGMLRKRQDEAELLAAQSDMWEGKLQPRYPAKRGGEDAYVLRSHLTLEERQQNIARLKSEASAKLRHANALQAETDELFAMAA